MKKTLLEAKKLALHEKVPVNTGHLMLALIRGDNPASKLLRDLGLQENKIRTQLRHLGDEPQHMWNSAIRTPRAAGKSKKPREPSPLHLLITVLNLKGSHAQTILHELGFNATDARKQALSRLRRPAEQHRTTASAEHRGQNQRDARTKTI